ncbi:NADH dehydrogenase [ubiquinone] 1 beta subcomplex subunit 11, mitochondrial [Pseudoscourfieldia marina]
MASSASHVKAAASRLANAVWSAAASSTARGASTSSANTAVATATTRRGLHTSARRHGGPDKGFWTEGTNVKEPGYLFGETPPPPGQSRKWESWELPWYSMMLLSGGILTVGLSVQPDTSIHTWAHKEALRRMEEGK